MPGLNREDRLIVSTGRRFQLTPCTREHATAPKGGPLAHAGLLPGDLHWLQTQEIDDDLVFHCTQADSLVAILSNGTLRLGPYSKTSDPCEQKERRAGLLMPAGPTRPPEKYFGVCPRPRERRRRSD